MENKTNPVQIPTFIQNKPQVQDDTGTNQQALGGWQKECPRSEAVGFRSSVNRIFY